MSLLQTEKLSQDHHIRKMGKFIWMVIQPAMFLTIKSMLRSFTKLIHTNLSNIETYIQRARPCFTPSKHFGSQFEYRIKR